MTATPAKTSRLWRISGMPRRGQISWFEVILLAGCIVWVAFNFAPALQDVVVLSFLFAGLALAWNIAGGCAGLMKDDAAYFVLNPPGAMVFREEALDDNLPSDGLPC